MGTGTMEMGAQALLMGLLATALLDAWAQVLKHAAGIIPTNWGLVGRWVATRRFTHLTDGQYRHDAIAQIPAIDHERLIGWSFHYGVGISYAVIFVLLSAVLSIPIALWSAIGFGMVTVLAPWLILQPGLGQGRFAANTPQPGKTRLLNLISHTVFGLGLYFTSHLFH